MTKWILALTFGLCSAVSFGAEISGVGIVLTQDDQKVFVVEGVIEGAPAQRAGIHSDEVITAVDGNSLAGQDLQAAVAQIRGPEGTPISLTVGDRAGHLRDVKMIRERFSVPEECFLEGNLDLHVSPYVRNTPPSAISGYVGQDFIGFNVVGQIQPNRYRVQGVIKGEQVQMDYQGGFNFGQESLTGVVHGTLVHWTGSNGVFTGHQECIQN